MVRINFWIFLAKDEDIIKYFQATKERKVILSMLFVVLQFYLLFISYIPILIYMLNYFKL